MAFLPRATSAQVTLVFLVDEDQWHGHFAEWLSPASQFNRFQAKGNPMQGFPLWAGGPLPLLAIAASCLEIELGLGASLFDIVWAVSQSVLGASDEEMLDICRVRTFAPRERRFCSRELYESNECEDTLGQDDHRELAQVKKRATGMGDDVEAFTSKYKERKVSVRAAAKRKPGGASSSSRPARAPATAASRGNAKPFVLQGWRGRSTDREAMASTGRVRMALVAQL